MTTRLLLITLSFCILPLQLLLASKLIIWWIESSVFYLSFIRFIKKKPWEVEHGTNISHTKPSCKSEFFLPSPIWSLVLPQPGYLSMFFCEEISKNYLEVPLICSLSHYLQGFLAPSQVVGLGISEASTVVLQKFWEKSKGLHHVHIFNHMGVSKNRGTPKWMVYNGKPH